MKLTERLNNTCNRFNNANNFDVKTECLENCKSIYELLKKQQHSIPNTVAKIIAEYSAMQYSICGVCNVEKGKYPQYVLEMWSKML